MLHLLRSGSLKYLSLFAIGVLSGNTWAHTGVLSEVHTHASAIGSLMAGWLHPWTGLDHLSVMLAVGGWGALTSRPGSMDWFRAPVIFVLMLLAGAVMGMFGVTLPSVEPMLAASVLVLGLMVFTRAQVSGVVSAVLVGTFALFHGVAHGVELSNVSYSVLTLAGLLVATLLLHVLGLVAGWNLRASSVWLTRAAGAAVAGVGAHLFLALA